MVSLASKMNSLNIYPNTNVTAVKELIDQAIPRVTFWGSRIVTVTNYTGSFYLDDFGGRILQIWQNSVWPTATPQQRIAGVETLVKLREFYRVTDDLIKNSNFFTKFLVWIREKFSFGIYTMSEVIGMNYPETFLTYNKDQFSQLFGDPSNPLTGGQHLGYLVPGESLVLGDSDHLNHFVRDETRDTYVAKEASVRALMTPA